MSGRIITTKNSVQANSLPEIGRIKIGIKMPAIGNKKEYPKAVDYFRPTGNFANEFTRLFGEKPQSLHICFISDNLSEVCNEQFESWVQGKRWGMGNGAIFTVWDAVAGKYVNDVPAMDKRVKALKWDRTLTLRFVLLKMTGILGYWTFQTKAAEVTIPSIVKSFDLVKERAGTIVGFPFNLQVELKKSYSPGEARTYPAVSLIPNFTEESIEAVRNYIEKGGQLNRITTRMIESGAIGELTDPKVLEIGAGEKGKEASNGPI